MREEVEHCFQSFSQFESLTSALGSGNEGALAQAPTSPHRTCTSIARAFSLSEQVITVLLRRRGAPRDDCEGPAGAVCPGGHPGLAATCRLQGVCVHWGGSP